MDSFGTRRVAAQQQHQPANYFHVQGLLAKLPGNETAAVAPDAGNHEIRSRKSAFIFVNMAQYVDWINLQMEKLNSYMYAWEFENEEIHEKNERRKRKNWKWRKFYINFKLKASSVWKNKRGNSLLAAEIEF